MADEERETSAIITYHSDAQRALAMEVTDDQSFEIMASFTLLFRKARKFFQDRLQPRIDQSNALTAALRADLNRDLAPIDRAQVHADEQISWYRAKQKKAAEVEAARLREEQDRKDKAEREELANLAREIGDESLANEIAGTKNTAPPIVAQPASPRVDDLSFRTDWFYEITDWNKIPTSYHRMETNPKGEWHCNVTKDITAEVKRLKGATVIPGVRVYTKETPVGRG